MDLNSYQQLAQLTDRVPSKSAAGAGIDLMVPLLGLAGETGELLSEYKKRLRDGESHLLFKEKICEELGDILWYIANVAEKSGLSLEDVAQKNLDKANGRWGHGDTSALVFDESFPEQERLPRKFEISLGEVNVDGKIKIRMLMNGTQVGDDLTDNADDPDGYRFHDVFHLAYIAVLGWSPVVRSLMKRKRKSEPKIDEVQDGGRAQVIDEAVAALVFDYAKEHRWLEGVTELDYKLLRTIKGVTSLLEVKERSPGEWQKAILLGFEVWRKVLRSNGGRLKIDQDSRSIIYAGEVETGMD